MEKQGIITRHKGKEDKCQQIVSLTEEGRAMEEKAYSPIPSGMSEKLSACPFDIDDYASLAKQLDTIIESLKNK